MEELPPPASFDPRDEEHLRSLVLGHKVMAGLLAVGSCCGLPHSIIGYSMLTDPSSFSSPGKPNSMPPGFGALFMVGGFFVIFGAITMSILTYVAGQRIKERKGWVFIFVVNCILCLIQPIGTVLGVLTLIILHRPSVKALFGNR